MSTELHDKLHQTAARPTSGVDMDAINTGIRRRKTRRLAVATSGALAAVVVGGFLVLAQGPAAPQIDHIGPGNSEPQVEQSEQPEPTEAGPEQLQSDLVRLEGEFDAAILALDEAQVAEAELLARQEAGEDVEDEYLAAKAERQELTTKVRSLANEKFAVEAQLISLGLLEDPIVAAREAVTADEKRMVSSLVSGLVWYDGAELQHLFGEELAVGLGTEIVNVYENDPLVGAQLVKSLDGEHSVQSLLGSDRVTQTLAGDHPHCAAAPKPAPQGYEDHRRLSIQPVDVVSCLQWWTVDMFINDDNKIEAITVDFWEQ